MPIIADGPRLLIRTWASSEAATLSHLVKQTGFALFSIGGSYDLDEEKALGWIAIQQDLFSKYQLGIFAVELKSTGETIGISGLFHMPAPNSERVEINFRYPQLHWGNGYGTEAAKALLQYGFSQLRLPAVYGSVNPLNFASIKTLKRIGLEKIDMITYRTIQAELWRIIAPN